MIFQFLQIQIKPLKAWLQIAYPILEEAPVTEVLEADLTGWEKSQLKDLISNLQIESQGEIDRLFIHLGSGDFRFSKKEKEQVRFSRIYGLPEVPSPAVMLLRSVCTKLIKKIEPQFNQEFFFVDYSLMSPQELIKAYRKTSERIELTLEQAQQRLDQSKIEMEAFIKVRPDLRRWK